MKANDIQIGDYVCGVLGNMRVVSIGKSTVSGQWADKDDPELIHETNCIYDVVYPIPITAELLQLNRVKQVYSSHISRRWELDYGDDYDIVLRYSINNKTWLVSAMSLKETIEVKKHIKYLHELQHILRLFGIQINENFKFE